MALGLVGVAGVFLVNSLVAFVEPASFVALVSNSALGGMLEIINEKVLRLSIAVNDLLIGIALLLTIVMPQFRPMVFGWAGLWLMGVTLVKVSALGLA
jgi:hypothetical protein